MDGGDAIVVVGGDTGLESKYSRFGEWECQSDYASVSAIQSFGSQPQEGREGG